MSILMIAFVLQTTTAVIKTFLCRAKHCLTPFFFLFANVFCSLSAQKCRRPYNVQPPAYLPLSIFLAVSFVQKNIIASYNEELFADIMLQLRTAGARGMGERLFIASMSSEHNRQFDISFIVLCASSF